MNSIHVALLAVVLVLCSSCHGMIETISGNIGFEIRSLHQFEYAPKGTLSLTATASFKSDIEIEETDDEITDNDANNENNRLLLSDITNELEMESESVSISTGDDDKEEGDEDEDGEEEDGENNSDSKLYLYHCTDDELDALSSYATLKQLCNGISSDDETDDENIETNNNADDSDSDNKNKFTCTWSDVLNNDNNEITYSFDSHSTQWMTLLAVNCDNSHSFHAQFELEAVNPNGEYLSLSEVPYKPLYLYLAGVWGFVAALWFIHWWRYIIFNVSLHQLLTFYPIFKSASCVMWHFYWSYCSSNGEESDKYTLMAYIASSLSDAWLAFCLMYIAQGWGILRRSFDMNRKKYEIWGITILVFISDILTNYFTSLLILLVISYVLTMRRILNGYTKIMRLLNAQFEILESVDSNTAHNNYEHPLNIKLSMYRSFQKCVILFIACEVIYYWGSSFLLETPWVNSILSNSIVLSLVLYIGWEFRMRPFRPNFHLFVTEDHGINNNNNLIDDNNNDDDFITDEWAPGMRAPLFPKDYNSWLSCNNGEIVVIENEIDLDKEGEPIKNYSVATPMLSFSKINKIGPFRDDHEQINNSINSINSINSQQRNSYQGISSDVIVDMSQQQQEEEQESSLIVVNSNQVNYEGSGILDNHSDTE